MSKKLIIISGGFDPIHSGHIAMFEEARELGDIIVLLNSDEWLQRKKGNCFMDWNDRMSVVSNLKGVINVLTFNDDDGTAVQGIVDVKKNYTKYDIYFANGGDRNKETTPESKFCLDNNINELFNVGGGKTQSSSNL